MKTAEYELVLMLDAAAPEQARETLAGEARAKIEGGGELRHAESWGIRKLAYEIEQRGEADYRFFRFTAQAPSLDDLRHSLRIADGVLRFRIFEVEPQSPLMTPPEITLGPSRERDGRGRRPRHGDEDYGDEGEGETAPEAPASEPPAAEAPAAEAPEAEAPAAEAPAAEAPAAEAPAAEAPEAQAPPAEAPEAEAPEAEEPAAAESPAEPEGAADEPTQ